MDKNECIKKNVHKNVKLGSTDVWSHFKEDPWHNIVEKSLKSETPKKLDRFKFREMIYEQYFI